MALFRSKKRTKIYLVNKLLRVNKNLTISSMTVTSFLKTFLLLKILFLNCSHSMLGGPDKMAWPTVVCAPLIYNNLQVRAGFLKERLVSFRVLSLKILKSSPKPSSP